MSDMASPVTFERLLAHREWVRAVARSIAFDAATADDLEQETWLEALRSPPRDDRNLRGWLGTVIRNRARKGGRSSARRAHHEAAAPVATAAPATANVVAEAEAQQRIVAAVLALGEPYRTTILLRFYEGLPPRTVGERMGVPAETVRTRVRRAAGKLRDALGGEGTGLESWMGAVTPLLALPGPSDAAGLAVKGAVAVHTKKTIAAATIAAMLLGGVCALVLTTPAAVAPPRAPIGDGHSTAGLSSPPTVEPEPPPRPPTAAKQSVPAAPPADPEPVEPAAVPAVVDDAPPATVDETDDRELTKNELMQEKVRAKYADDREGFPFYDLVYWVNAAKLEDSRWKQLDVENATHTRGLQLHAKWTNEASAADGMTIEVIAIKLRHESRKDGKIVPFAYPFDNLGESIRCSDLSALMDGFYEDWKCGAKDVLEDRCREPRRAKLRIGKVLSATAVGADAESEQRQRREWYGWIDFREGATYVIEIRYGSALWDNEALVDKGQDLMKNLGEIKDKVKWDDDDD